MELFLFTFVKTCDEVLVIFIQFAPFDFHGGREFVAFYSPFAG
jgi:hypothetical protein